MEKTYSMMVQGKMNFMGIEIPVVSGGFGDGKMCVTDKTVAEIHGQQTRQHRCAADRHEAQTATDRATTVKR